MNTSTRLTRRTFRTEDSNGCEFYAEGFYEKEAWQRKSKPVKYCGLGLEAPTLKELQDMASKL